MSKDFLIATVRMQTLALILTSTEDLSPCPQVVFFNLPLKNIFSF